MNSKIKYHITIACLYALLIFFATGCKDSSEDAQGCCSFPAIEATVGGAQAYMPNVFTPDANGINDFITVFGDSLVEIVSMQIFDQHHNLVFNKEHFLPGDPAQGWDGVYLGQRVGGIFDVAVVVTSFDGFAKTLTGKICSYPCAFEGNQPISGDGCQFPAQFNGTGYDPTLPSFEDGGCFE